MPYYKIAGLTVKMNPKQDRVKRSASKYLCGDIKANPDFSINVSNDLINRFLKEYPELNKNRAEYILECSCFSAELLNFDSFVLHASAVMYQGFAYLFSAHSGTGKSTHTKLWQQYFGEKNVVVINDDKPIIRKFDGKWCACGSPFCGKNDLGENIIVPIKGVAFLEQCDTNRIVSMSTENAIFKFFDLTLRPGDNKRMEKLMSVIEAFVLEVPVYLLNCNMSLDAAKVAYEGMSGCKANL